MFEFEPSSSSSRAACLIYIFCLYIIVLNAFPNLIPNK